MRKTTMRGFFRPQLLATAVALGINPPAYADNFSGEIQGSFDS